MSRLLSLPQFLLFAATGALGTIVHYVVLVACVQFLDIPPVVGSLVGYVAGAVTNFLLSHRITFRSGARYRNTAPRFFAVAAMGFMTNWLLMHLLIHVMNVNYLVAQLVATMVILFSNYVANALWTFRDRSHDH